MKILRKIKRKVENYRCGINSIGKPRWQRKETTNWKVEKFLNMQNQEQRYIYNLFSITFISETHGTLNMWHLCYYVKLIRGWKRVKEMTRKSPKNK